MLIVGSVAAAVRGLTNPAQIRDNLTELEKNSLSALAHIPTPSWRTRLTWSITLSRALG